MAGLREACDDFVALIIREREMQAMTEGPSLDIVATLRDAGLPQVISYLAEVLADNSPAVNRLVDAMIDDAQTYLQAGVESGMIKPSEDPRGRAVVLLLSTLGSLVMHRHLYRLLGADLTGQNPADPNALAAYYGPTYEFYAQGLFTPAFGSRAAEAVARMRSEENQSTTTMSESGGSDD